MYEFKDKLVVVTGGSTGIGAAFAHELKRRGARLVLVARGKTKLEALARELGGAQVISQDLAVPGAAALVRAAIKEPVDVLINNAGFAAFGRFEALDVSVATDQIDLNVRSLVELTHTFLPDLERQRGGVIHVASTASFQPVPFMAIYGASKAFVLSFSEALWAEYRDRHVRVLALCPGATDTPFFERSGEAAAVGTKAPAEDVVRVGLEAFGENRSHVIHGFGNYLTCQASRFVSRELTTKITAGVMRPRVAALPQKT